MPLDPVVRTRLEQNLDVSTGGAPTVVIVRPDAYTESVVSSHTDSGFDIADLYTQHGFRVRGVEPVEIHKGGPLIVKSATVLHLTARLDMRGAGPYLDLSPVAVSERFWRKASGMDIRPRDVARWLRGCEPGREPLVVLDPPNPGSPYDVPWQLVLRNLFAATLFAEGGVPAIIASGLRTTGSPYVGAIAVGTASGRPLASRVLATAAIETCCPVTCARGQAPTPPATCSFPWSACPGT